MPGKSKWMVPLAILSYLLYVVTFICPQNSPSNFVHNLTCESYAYIRPSVEPFIETVTIKLDEVVSKLHLEPLLSKVGNIAADLRTFTEPWIDQAKQELSQLTSKLSAFTAPLINFINSKVFELKIRVTPKLKIWLHVLKVHLHVGITKIWDWVELKVKILWVEFKYKLNDIFSNRIKPYFNIYLFRIQNSSTYLVLKHYYYEYKLDVAVDWISCCYQNLMDANSNQEKRNFLKNEFKNLMQFRSGVVLQGNEAEVSEVVKNILEEITSSLITSVTDSSKETSSVITSTSSTLDITDSLYEESDSDIEEPITILITSTRIVTLGAPTSEASMIDNSISHKIEAEVNYWENKVSKTLNSAMKNLSKDMSVIVRRYIDAIKPELSEKLSNVQQNNYQYYKELNSMINSIDKDSAQIQEEHMLIESASDSGRDYVSRQDMRDKISESLTSCESKLNDIKEIIQRSRQDVLNEYFKEIQDTIDVLESFADLTIQEFSNRLHSLITVLENEKEFDEEVTWKAWKRFHKIKQEIFNARDLIFDQANAYQDDSFSLNIPIGLEDWCAYVKNLYFHANFLTNDNEEYLRLVRAKANVAFQLREKLIDQLKEPKDSEDSNTSPPLENNQEQSSETLSGESPIENEASDGSPLDYDSGADSENVEQESEDSD